MISALNAAGVLLGAAGVLFALYPSARPELPRRRSVAGRVASEWGIASRVELRIESWPASPPPTVARELAQMVVLYLPDLTDAERRLMSDRGGFWKLQDEVLARAGEVWPDWVYLYPGAISAIVGLVLATPGFIA